MDHDVCMIAIPALVSQKGVDSHPQSVILKHSQENEYIPALYFKVLDVVLLHKAPNPQLQVSLSPKMKRLKRMPISFQISSHCFPIHFLLFKVYSLVFYSTLFAAQDAFFSSPPRCLHRQHHCASRTCVYTSQRRLSFHV